MFLATIATWCIVALWVYLSSASPWAHVTPTCQNLEGARAGWPGVSVVLILLLAVNLSAAFLKGQDGRFAQVLSLVVSLPMVWIWCPMVFVASSSSCVV